MPEMIGKEPGYIDGVKVEDMRSADYTPLFFALVKRFTPATRSRATRSNICARMLTDHRRGYPSPKPLPAKRIPADIRSLCRSYTDEAVRSLAAIMRNGDKDATRVAAAAILLDRGWGKAPQPHTGEDDPLASRGCVMTRPLLSGGRGVPSHS